MQNERLNWKTLSKIANDALLRKDPTHDSLRGNLFYVFLSKKRFFFERLDNLNGKGYNTFIVSCGMIKNTISPHRISREDAPPAESASGCAAKLPPFDRWRVGAIQPVKVIVFSIKLGGTTGKQARPFMRDGLSFFSNGGNQNETDCEWNSDGS